MVENATMTVTRVQRQSFDRERNAYNFKNNSNIGVMDFFGILLQTYLVHEKQCNGDKRKQEASRILNSKKVVE